MENEFTFQRVRPEAISQKLFGLNSATVGLDYHHDSRQSGILQVLARSSRLSLRNPLFLIATLWPLVLLTPHVPGIPRPGVSGLPWRQELTLSILLAFVLTLLSVRWKDLSIRLAPSTLLAGSALSLFVVWTAASTLWSATPYAALHLAMQWAIYLFFFLVMSSFASSPRLLHSSFVALAGIICMLALACLIESWFGAPLTDGSLRSDFKPILRGSAGFGEIMAMAAILFASLALHINKRRVALACGVIALLSWLATLQSLERAPFIGAVVGLALLIAGTATMKVRLRQSPMRLFLLVGALAGILMLQSMPSLTNSASHSTSTITRLQQNVATDNSTRVRLLFWGVGLEMARANPILGVGGNNYESAFPWARQRFAGNHPKSPLVGMNEQLLTVYAHNEYLQMLAELGLVGFGLFVILSLTFLANFWKALKQRKQAIPVLGAGGAMLAFAISSGASGSSFRYFGGGLLFFFAAAIMTRVAAIDMNSTSATPAEAPRKSIFTSRSSRVACACMAAIMFLVVGTFSVQATGAVLHGLAQSNTEPTLIEGYYRSSLKVFPPSPATHFSYGLWLKNQRRPADAVPHLAYAVDHGFNSSICYSYLAGAQESAGNQPAAEQTLANAVQTYPVSVFLLVRHAVELQRIGRQQESDGEFARALLLNPAMARGWQQLIVNDIDAAMDAAKLDSTIALPGQLIPESAVFQVLQENEQRFPELVDKGWRARMRTQQPQ